MVDLSNRMRSCCFVDDLKLPKNCDLRLVPDQTISTAVVPSVRKQYRLRLSNTEGSADAVSTEPWTDALWNGTDPARSRRISHAVDCTAPKPQQAEYDAAGLAQAMFFFSSSDWGWRSMFVAIWSKYGHIQGACWRVSLFCSGYLSRMQLDRSWLRGRAHGPREPVSDRSARRNGVRTNVQPRHVVSLRNRGYSGHGWRYRTHIWSDVIWLPGTDHQPVAHQRSIESRSQVGQ